jgi:hypothetical protein
MAAPPPSRAGPKRRHGSPLTSHGELPSPKPPTVVRAQFCLRDLPPQHPKRLVAQSGPQARRSAATSDRHGRVPPSPLPTYLFPLPKHLGALPKAPWSPPRRRFTLPDRELVGIATPAASAAGLHRDRSPTRFPRQPQPQFDPSCACGHPRPLPQPRKPVRSPEFRPSAPPHPQGLHCLVWDLSRGFCANEGYTCESSDLLGACSQKVSYPFECF